MNQDICLCAADILHEAFCVIIRGGSHKIFNNAFGECTPLREPWKLQRRLINYYELKEKRKREGERRREKEDGRRRETGKKEKEIVSRIIYEPEAWQSSLDSVDAFFHRNAWSFTLLSFASFAMLLQQMHSSQEYHKCNWRNGNCRRINNATLNIYYNYNNFNM